VVHGAGIGDHNPKPVDTRPAAGSRPALHSASDTVDGQIGKDEDVGERLDCLPVKSLAFPAWCDAVLIR
jgi:hypothetical protein